MQMKGLIDFLRLIISAERSNVEAFSCDFLTRQTRLFLSPTEHIVASETTCVCICLCYPQLSPY